LGTLSGCGWVQRGQTLPLTPKEAVFMKFGEVTNLKMAGCAFPPSIHPSWWVLFGWMGTVRFKAMMVAWGDLCRR